MTEAPSPTEKPAPKALQVIEAMRRLQPRKSRQPRTPRLSITLPVELVDWLEDQVAAGRFHNRSHGIAYCLRRCQDTDPPAK